VLKDRLYADAAGSHSRRSAQTVLAAVLGDVVRLVAPVLSFTAEEVWQSAAEPLRDGVVSVHLAGWPVAEERADAAVLRAAYGVVLATRDAATKALEDARNAGEIGKSQQARLRVRAVPEDRAVLEARGAEALAEMFIVSAVVLEPADDCEAEAGAPGVIVEAAEGAKCPRCWNWRELGADGLCARCSTVVSAL